jgi:hypothetical protein
MRNTRLTLKFPTEVAAWETEGGGINIDGIGTSCEEAK